MASTRGELTSKYEEGGETTVKELDKEILSKGAWSTIIFGYQDRDRQKGEYGPGQFAICRYQKRGGQYQQKSHLDISSVDQAKKVVATRNRWINE